MKNKFWNKWKWKLKKEHQQTRGGTKKHNQKTSFQIMHCVDFWKFLLRQRWNFTQGFEFPEFYKPRRF